MAFFSPTVTGGYTPLYERPVSDYSQFYSTAPNTAYVTLCDISGTSGFLDFLYLWGQSGLFKITIDGVVVSLDEYCSPTTEKIGPNAAMQTSAGYWHSERGFYFSESLKIEHRSNNTTASYARANVRVFA